MTPDRRYAPNEPEYPIWIAQLYIRNMVKLHPGQDPEDVLNKTMANMPEGVKNIIMKVATDMFLNNEL